MPTLDPDHRLALTLLAGSADGCTTMILLALGVASTLVAALIADGLATAKVEHVRAGSRPVDVTRVRITDAGRAALEG
jgi:hypothetical protein